MLLTKPIEESAIWGVPALCSPHADVADAKTLGWVDSLGLCEDSAEREDLVRVRPGLLAAYCHPEASEADVTLAAKWMAWLFLLDDRIDESALGRDADLLEDYLQDVLQVALGTHTAAGLMGLALEGIIAQASIGMSDAWQMRFRRHVSDYLSACIWQAAHRQAADVPNPDVFPQWRRAFGAIVPSFDLIERMDGGALPSSAYYSRSYQELFVSAADLVCWTNDLMTVDKEAAHGDLHNLVLVVEHDQRHDRQKAVAVVSAACVQRLRTHTSAGQELPFLTATLGLPEGDRQHADRCANSLLVWVRGHLEWGLRTPRYHFETDETRKD